MSINPVFRHIHDALPSRPTELLTLGSYNVIAVEWSMLAAAPWYPTAVASVPQVSDRPCLNIYRDQCFASTLDLNQ